ncbi:response regulator [Sphingomonas sp. PB2P19]|uniref:response regulator n=1 Tax=Sphingomonas rhamnosi TaxID=3096156 RepID=UPI002FCAA89D
MREVEPKHQEAAQRLHDRCVLIVEDEYLLADDLARGFDKEGISIVGPVPSLAQALELVEQKRINMAVLDIALDGDKVYDVADALIRRNVAVLFVTGYDRSDIPARFAKVPMCQKPVGADEVIAALARLVAE